jgi:penicillin-binding protein 1C
MSRVLGKHYSYNGQYNDRNWHEAYYLKQLNTEQNKPTLEKQTSYIGSDAIWFAFQAMNEVVRPTSEGEWERFQSSRRVAWKTGTSFGNRDAWAIGITPAFAVGIWIGNGDGEGRPGLIGVQTAAPFLFDLFELLPESKWFDPPYDNMRKVRICSQSGFLALESCPVDTVYTPTNALNAQACPYHQILHLDNSGKWRVNAACESPNAMKTESWFVLPPLEEHYYKQRNPSYKSLPPFREDCKTYATRASEATMQLIYPKNAVKIYVPIDLDGNLSRTVFKVAHRSEEAMLYWHLDNEYIGSTKTFHSFELLPSAGKHRLTVVDQNGNILEQEFEVLVKKE